MNKEGMVYVSLNNLNGERTPDVRTDINEKLKEVAERLVEKLREVLEEQKGTRVTDWYPEFSEATG